MQRPDPAKERLILDAAAELFGQRSYHEVRLEDVATRAHLGKGTLYIYFHGKEQLYLAVVRDGFARVIENIERRLKGESTAWDRLGAVVDELISFGFRFPGLYRVMRSGGLTPDDPELQRLRSRLTGLIERILRESTGSGELNDPFPELTAQYLLSFVRGVALYPPPNFSPATLRNHMLALLQNGLATRAAGGVA